MANVGAPTYRILCNSDDAHSRLRVLVVDHDKDAGHFLAKLVEIWGHDVHVAHAGADAIEAAALFQPDMVFAEVLLPDIDGYALGRCLRQLCAGRLIAVTSVNDPASRQSAWEAGFSLCMLKPITVDELQRVLQTKNATDREKQNKSCSVRFSTDIR
jgi:CheY-like chemotaxis protein